jgi:TatD DNase family protein
MKFFDTHAHLTDDDAYSHPDEIIENAKNKGVTKIVNICSDANSLRKAFALRQKYKNVFIAAASNPHLVDNDNDLFFEDVKKACYEKKLVAIGECGLDYFYGLNKKEHQKKILKNYLTLAKQLDFPIVFHVRDAFDDFFKFTDEHCANHKKAIVHCFSGTLKESQEILKRGWFISFSGIVTFKNSLDLQKIVKEIPLDRILIETDSPLLAPQSKRGKKNEPANVVEIAQKIADIKKLSLDEIARTTYDNSLKIFDIIEIN